MFGKRVLNVEVHGDQTIYGLKHFNMVKSYKLKESKQFYANRTAYKIVLLDHVCNVPLE